MTKQNLDLRMEAKKKSIPLWAIADEMGVSEQTLIRKWRKELPDAEKAKTREIIADLSRKEA